MKLKTNGFWLLFVVIAFVNFAQAQTGDKDLPNFYQVNAKLYRGGQPSETGITKLAAMGVKTIIDLRGTDKNSLKEKHWAENAGIKFIAVDLSNWFEPGAADIAEIMKDIDAPENQPVFVHCKRGADRTGTVVAVYRISHDDWTARHANDEAKRFGFGWWQVWMKDYINDYYRDFKNNL